jgi:hypothetical protein
MKGRLQWKSRKFVPWSPAEPRGWVQQRQGPLPPAPVIERLAKQVPFPPRLGKAGEFAKLACHIIENTYLNGESIRLDVGLRMGFGRK